MSGLFLHSSNRLEVLASELAKVLHTPLSSPLAPEIIAVQSKGMERWLSLQLATIDGIWANYRFPFPTALIRELLASLLGPTAESPLLVPENLNWRLMEILPAKLANPTYQHLAPYLHDHEQDDLRLWQLCGRIADTFDQYLVYRHQLINDWEEGRLQHLGPHEEWQADLWRTLVSGVDAPLHRAKLTEIFRAKLASDPEILLPLLPERITLFGVSTLPPLHLQLLDAIAALIPVHLFFLNPCEGYWLEIRSPREAARLLRRAAEKGLDAEEVYIEAGHPLLSSLGRSGRNFLSRLLDLNGVDNSVFVPASGAGLLPALQRDILGTDWPLDWPPPTKQSVAPDDHSLQIHACHGPLREVEVLHDLLLTAFSEIPGLAPRDVLVMAPDIEIYAPYIDAVFSRAGRERSSSGLPYTIADRGQRSSGELLIAFERLCSLPGSRCTAAELLDLLQLAPVARRFGLSPGDDEIVQGWIKAVNIRWGLDADFRVKEGLPANPACTWQAGLDRLLLGIALPEHGDLFGGILPASGGEGSNSALLGALCDFIAALRSWIKITRTVQTPQEWSDCLIALLDTFFDAGEENDAFLRLRRLCVTLAEEASLGAFSGAVSFAVIRSRLITGLAESSTHGFLSGPITFCTLQPMRSVPFKVIALIGMNDNDFPRSSHPTGFDLMPLKVQLCDPARRDEDRYLFLEALLSARQRLLITWQGEDPRDGSQSPPSVVVGELLDAIEASFELAPSDSLPPFQGEGRVGDGMDLIHEEQPHPPPHLPLERGGIKISCIRDHIVTRHHLQPFSPAYFTAGNRMRSYDPLWHAAVLARLQRGGGEIAPLFSAPLPCLDPLLTTVTLDELERFLKNPAKFFLQNRLQLRLITASEALPEREPFLLDGLERYNLGQPLATRLLSGSDASGEEERARAAGLLPDGPIGAGSWRHLFGQVEAFTLTVKEQLPEESKVFEIDLPAAGLRLCGEIEGVGTDSALFWRYASLKGKDCLSGWLRHLALNASGRSLATTLIGKDGALTFAPLSVPAAQSCLDDLVALYEQGWRQPLPFFPQSAFVYAQVMEKEEDADKALAAARKVWEKDEFNPASGEEQDPYYRLAFPDDPLNAAFTALALEIFRPLLVAGNDGEGDA
ncbi:MAG: exodeoxyribonuclease V subunit gamma [Desulfuromonadales bacterium]|nr:exodeoxyribonuclease V subunit gamma [Desulfuromonadales bacterium]